MEVLQLCRRLNGVQDWHLAAAPPCFLPVAGDSSNCDAVCEGDGGDSRGSVFPVLFRAGLAMKVCQQHESPDVDVKDKIVLAQFHPRILNPRILNPRILNPLCFIIHAF